MCNGRRNEPAVSTGFPSYLRCRHQSIAASTFGYENHPVSIFGGNRTLRQLTNFNLKVDPCNLDLFLSLSFFLRLLYRTYFHCYFFFSFLKEIKNTAENVELNANSQLQSFIFSLLPVIANLRHFMASDTFVPTLLFAAESSGAIHFLRTSRRVIVLRGFLPISTLVARFCRLMRVQTEPPCGAVGGIGTTVYRYVHMLLASG
jgi:uncharacterized membrane protein YobD (UPF0266 family)